MQPIAILAVAAGAVMVLGVWVTLGASAATRGR
jgi:hypothetical protein